MANLSNQGRDIQGIIITGYGHLQYSSYLFLHIDDPAKAKAWLEQIAPQMTMGEPWETGPQGEILKPESALNIAFTCQGLAELGLPPESLNSFSPEFVQGIAEEARSRRLGDTGDSDPKNWEIGGPHTTEANQIHALLIVQGGPKEIEKLCQTQIDLAESHSVQKIGKVQQGYLPFEDGVEHFGFADAISQPNIEGSPRKDADDQPCIKPGEFILGYPNEYDLPPSSPTVPTAADVHNNLKPIKQASTSNQPQPKDFGHNGSYLVFRKLHQDVAGFRRYLRDNFSQPVERELVAAKFVGRWPSGAPLVLTPDEDKNPELWSFPKNNNFSYAATDSQGYRCPLGAHIRRVNPRDSLGDPQESIRSVNRHRIIRRGALYGDKLSKETFEDDGKDRGVLFFCINADIQRQFEFIQQTWINNRKFSGLYNDKDPLLGDHDGASYDMTIQHQPVRQRLSGLPRFVSVKGGGYFFLPSLSALYFLAGKKNPNP